MWMRGFVICRYTDVDNKPGRSGLHDRAGEQQRRRHSRVQLRLGPLRGLDRHPRRRPREQPAARGDRLAHPARPQSPHQGRRLPAQHIRLHHRPRRQQRHEARLTAVPLHGTQRDHPRRKGLRGLRLLRAVQQPLPTEARLQRPAAPEHAARSAQVLLPAGQVRAGGVAAPAGGAGGATATDDPVGPARDAPSSARPRRRLRAGARALSAGGRAARSRGLLLPFAFAFHSHLSLSPVDILFRTAHSVSRNG